MLQVNLEIRSSQANVKMPVRDVCYLFMFFYHLDLPLRPLCTLRCQLDSGGRPVFTVVYNISIPSNSYPAGNLLCPLSPFLPTPALSKA